jgi:hypothetical protein
LIFLRLKKFNFTHNIVRVNNQVIFIKKYKIFYKKNMIGKYKKYTWISEIYKQVPF